MNRETLKKVWYYGYDTGQAPKAAPLPASAMSEPVRSDYVDTGAYAAAWLEWRAERILHGA